MTHPDDLRALSARMANRASLYGAAGDRHLAARARAASRALAVAAIELESYLVEEREAAGKKG